eukprot:scaffold1831_cov198-Alexandrium_tamarense.AAC.15
MASICHVASDLPLRDVHHCFLRITLVAAINIIISGIKKIVIVHGHLPINNDLYTSTQQLTLDENGYGREHSYCRTEEWRGEMVRVFVLNVRDSSQTNKSQ